MCDSQVVELLLVSLDAVKTFCCLCWFLFFFLVSIPVLPRPISGFSKMSILFLNSSVKSFFFSRMDSSEREPHQGTQQFYIYELLNVEIQTLLWMNVLPLQSVV